MERYITNARQAQVFILMARTAEHPRCRGISAFMVPAGLPGLGRQLIANVGQDGSATSGLLRRCCTSATS